jgi:uncharacterized RDD family membrane protein YckC
MSDAPGSGDPTPPDEGDSDPPRPLLPPPPPPPSGYPGAYPPPPPPAYPPPYGPPGYGPPGYPGGYPTPGYGPPGYGPPRSPFASYGARVGSWLIDWVITSIIGAIVLLPIHAVHQTNTTIISGSRSTSTLGFTVTPQGFLLSVLIVLIYATAFIGSSRGQTIGMMAVRARAVDAVSGAPIGHGRALGRALFEYLMLFLLVVPWLLDMLFPLWDPRRQTLHDKVTNTVVIKT